MRRFAAHESFTPATELASCYRTGSMFLSSLIMTKIKLCDLPNLSFLLDYDLILPFAGSNVFHLQHLPTNTAPSLNEALI